MIGVETETHSQTLGEARGTPQKKGKDELYEISYFKDRHKQNIMVWSMPFVLTHTKEIEDSRPL